MASFLSLLIKWPKWKTIILSLLLLSLIDLSSAVKIATSQTSITTKDDAEDKYGKPDDEAKPKDRSIEAETKERWRNKMKNIDAWRDQIAGKTKPGKPLTTRDKMDETLYVHMVANTHDDIGWLKTIDEYFSGTNTES